MFVPKKNKTSMHGEIFIMKWKKSLLITFELSLTQNGFKINSAHTKPERNPTFEMPKVLCPFAGSCLHLSHYI